MVQSVSPFLVRTAGIAVVAAILVLAVFAPTRAENLDGYGIQPLPATGGISNSSGISNYGRVAVPEPVGGGTYGPAAAANNSYNAAPVGGGYYPPQPAPGYGAAPVSTYAPMPTATAAPASDGYMPAAGGYVAPAAPAAYAQPAYRPQPAYQQPRYQPQVAAATGYGYKPGQGMAPAQPTHPQDTAYNYYQTGEYPGVRRENSDYVLGAGDKLKLTVFEEADLSGDYTIDGTGFLRLPLIGQVRAAGLNSTQLEAAIGSSLSRGYLRQPRVSVQVSTYRPFYIIGAVTKPGEYPYVNHMNALNAIALAGGFTPSAIESSIYVRREGSNTEVKMPTDRSTPIYPGDVVRVNNTLFADAMSLLGPLSTPLSIAAATGAP